MGRSGTVGVHEGERRPLALVGRPQDARNGEVA
jgi:hypothetical protein